MARGYIEHLVEVTETVREEWGGQTAEEALKVELGDNECDILLHVLSSAPNDIRKNWKIAATEDAIEKFTSESGESDVDDILNTEQIDTSGEISFHGTDNDLYSDDDIISVLAHTLLTKRVSRPEVGPFETNTLLRPVPCDSQRYANAELDELTLSEQHQQLEDTLAELGFVDSDRNIRPQFREGLIFELFQTIKADIEQSSLTEREFVTHHLSNVFSNEEISQILGTTYNSSISAGATHSYHRRAQEKIQSAMRTLEVTSNRLTAPIDMERLTTRSVDSLLTDFQKTDISKTIRTETIVHKTDGQPNRYSWELADNSTLTIEANENSFEVSVAVTISEFSDSIYAGGDIAPLDSEVEPPAELQSHSERPSNKPTRYSTLAESYLQTEKDIQDAFHHGFTADALNSWRALQTGSVFADDETGAWRVHFLTFIPRQSDRDDPTEQPVFGCRYRTTSDDDSCFRIVRHGEYDTFVQYDNGRGGDIPTSQLEFIEYAGGADEVLTVKPCKTSSHDFGDAKLGDDEVHLTTCRICGYSISTLEYVFGGFPRNQLLFECDICGETKKPGSGHKRYPPEVEPKVCDSCWESTYYPQVDDTEDSFSSHIITCRNLLTSVETWEFPEDAEFEPSCRWIGRATDETVTHYFSDKSDEHPPVEATPITDSACPHCGDEGRHALKWLDITNTTAGRALIETLAPDSGPEAQPSALFEDNNSVKRILTESEHDELLNQYHRLERSEAESD